MEYQSNANQLNESLETLQNSRNDLTQRRKKVRLFYQSLVVAGIITAVGVVVYLFVRAFKNVETEIYVPLIITYSLFPLCLAQMYRIRLREIEADLQELDFQIDLQQFSVNQPERRAEKLLRINDFQLRRYYDLNLRQNNWVFMLGVGCILLGITLVGMTLYLVVNTTLEFKTQIIISALGAIGAILSNFVAVIYLKMNAVASDNLAIFHSKLVETQQTLLSNLLASRIDDDAKRWDTLSQLSLKLVVREK